MDHVDVLIIGGGPAGSSCAWGLRASGLSVAVMDKKSFPRDKTCAGWVTPQVLQTLQINADEYARGRTMQPITGFRTGVIGGREVLTRYERPVSYGIRRCEFDHYLLERSGAEFRLGEPLKSCERRDAGWIVNGGIEARLIVGAGGHFCPVARMLGARDDEASTVVAAQEVEFEASADDLARGRIEAEIPELFFCEDLQGYGWCFRKGNFLNIGLGRSSAEQLTAHIAEFCDFLRERGKIAGDIPAKFHGHAYQLYERTQPRLLDDGVLLVGDAVGLAYPQSGEGIRPAVESALIAADVIASADGDYRRERLEPYAARLEERLGAPRRHSARDWLPAPWLRLAASQLLSSAWFSRRVVLDEWFLHAKQPALRPVVRASGVADVRRS